MTKEERREYNRKWREAHPDYDKKYHLEHKDERREQMKQYRLEHADECKEKSKQYYLEHADERREYKKQYSQTKKGRALSIIRAYNQKDTIRGFDISNNITSDWIIENVFSGQRCVYCGEDDWKKLGTDRVDNDKPHTPDNCIPCCGICNMERSDKYSVEEFKEYRKLYPRTKNPVE